MEDSGRLGFRKSRPDDCGEEERQQVVGNALRLWLYLVKNRHQVAYLSLAALDDPQESRHDKRGHVMSSSITPASCVKNLSCMFSSDAIRRLGRLGNGL